ncbi:hypothetical protein N0V90_007995 [Kalmusia sp. IMI 367209]|nr:hypothetical protein N0V90_007995 [Kalmusia sp. IMI 367209]
MLFLNPFKKHDASEFPNTHIDLEKAHHRNSIASARRQSISQAPNAGDKDDRSPGKGSDAHSGNDSDRAGSTRGLTIAELREEIDSDLAANDSQSLYDRKSKIINRAIADMGMGRYQWQLFVLCGCGWLADNLWLQGVALTLPSISAEFGVSENEVRYTTLSLFLGLCIGASFWGVASDVVGRRLAFNFTLMFAGIFGLAAGGSPELDRRVRTTQTWLSDEILETVGGKSEKVEDIKMSTAQIIKNSLGKFSTQRIGPLFKDRTIALTMILLWFQWTTIGMGYPLFNAFLPQYLANSGSEQPTSVSVTYRNYAITSICGCPGSLLAYYLVNIPHVGRKKTMIVGTALTGVFVFLFTLSGDASFQLAFSCLEACFQQVMYGVLYAYTPEVIPAPNRGTGTGISSFLNRLAGLCAPIVAVNAGSANPKAPIYASGGLILAAFVSMIFLPIETQGKQTL